MHTTRIKWIPFKICVVLVLLLHSNLHRSIVVHSLATRSTDTQNGDVAVVRRLLQRANIPLARVQDIRRVTAKSAFCNALYRVTMMPYDDENHNNNGNSLWPYTNVVPSSSSSSSYMAKVFSPLAASRMQRPSVDDDRGNKNYDNYSHDETRLFRIDELAAEHDLGPKIFATIDTTSSPALLMQDCPGNPMSELELQENKHIVRLAAEALAKLHTLTPISQISTDTSRNNNMLWQSCHVLMQQYADPRWCVPDGDRTPWTYDRLYNCIRKHEMELEQDKDLFVTDTGHGDCKPSNLLVQDGDSVDHAPRVRFLDLELAGTHYVAFDIAKLWRTSSYKTAAEQVQRTNQRQLFLQTYTEHFPGDAMVNASILQDQVDRLIPLTWLEAAAFFVAMSATSSKNQSEREHWDSLALDRLRSYTEYCNSALPS